MIRQTFNSANVPAFDPDERRAIVDQALERGLDDLRCPRDGKKLLVKELPNTPGRFAVECLECRRWALTLEAPPAEGRS